MKTTKATSSTVWECSGEPSPGRAHPPIDNYGDVCIICGRLRPGVTVRRDRRPLLSSLWAKSIAACLLLAALFAGGYGLLRSGQFLKSGEQSSNLSSNPSGTSGQFGSGAAVSPAVSPNVAPDSPLRFSRGERRLLSYQSNRDGELGTGAFAKGDYAKAKEYFSRAVMGDRRDPELQIYLNNADARLAKAEPFTLAITAPIDSNATTAEELLRGAADAQTEFNKKGGLNGRKLELVIANDGNNLKVIPGLARTLIANANVLGIIGHNSSAASEAAIGEYQAARVAMVSPTSTSTLISSPVFFRTVPSGAVLGSSLAEHARRTLKADQIAVFYNPNDPFSASIQMAFTKHFRDIGGRFVQTIDISNADFDPKKAIDGLKGEFDSMALLANVELQSVALSVTTANDQLPPAQRMKMVGSNTMYRPQTLSSGGSAVKGLTLVVPWFANTPYADRAAQRWGGRVSWRTACSYDATLALVSALSPDASRASVLEKLRTVRLSADQTAGDALAFSASGDRLSKPLFVRVVEGKGGPEGSGLSFQLVKE
jgi:branched-chain amino acid transport system substrate-binding protein